MENTFLYQEKIDGINTIFLYIDKILPEELLLKTPNSIFINKARKRYRLLRTNNLLKL